MVGEHVVNKVDVYGWNSVGLEVVKEPGFNSVGEGHLDVEEEGGGYLAFLPGILDFGYY